MIFPVAFHTTDWNTLPVEVESGEKGHATMKTLQLPGVRIRLVTYSKNYLANHWCAKGHLLFCLDGIFVTEFQDGSRHTLTENMSFQVSNNMGLHRTSSLTGARLWVVDGDFLTPKKKYVAGAYGLN